MTVKVPAAAVPIPIACFLVRFSLSIRAESAVIKIGESRQTKIEAMEALAIWIPVTCAMKKMVIPVRARIRSLGMSFLWMTSV